MTFCTHFIAQLPTRTTAGGIRDPL